MIQTVYSGVWSGNLKRETLHATLRNICERIPHKKTQTIKKTNKEGAEDVST